MKKESSKEVMDTLLNQLQGVHRVATPEHIYTGLLARIQRQKQQTISLTWVRTAAAVFVLLVSSEIYLVTQQTRQDNQEPLEELVSVTNNLLYHE